METWAHAHHHPHHEAHLHPVEAGGLPPSVVTLGHWHLWPSLKLNDNQYNTKINNRYIIFSIFETFQNASQIRFSFVVLCFECWKLSSWFSKEQWWLLRRWKKIRGTCTRPYPFYLQNICKIQRSAGCPGHAAAEWVCVCHNFVLRHLDTASVIWFGRYIFSKMCWC